MAETYEAVTPDCKESDIAKVKVRRTITLDIDAGQIEAVMALNQDLKTETVEMLRLEIIDDELGKLAAERDNLDAKIKAKQALRTKVEEAAKTVKLIT